MKRFFFIWLFIPFISCCQTSSEYKLQNSILVEWGKNCISEIGCFYLTLDSTLVFDDDDIYDYYYTLYYSYRNINKQVVATGDWIGLAYGSTLSGFKSEKENSYVVIWKVDGEFLPLFYVYYIKNDRIMKIGEWGIIEPCDNCDTGDYLVEEIRIHQRDEKLEFSFLKEMSFVVYKDLSKSLIYDDWGSFKAGGLIISFNIIDGTVKKIAKN